MIDIQSLMNQAKNFQQNLKEDLGKMAVHSNSGGGAVSVVVNGNKELTKIEFTPEAMRDRELLADLVLAALSGAYAEVDEKVASKLPKLDSLDLSSLGDILKQ